MGTEIHFWEERTTVKHSHYLIADNMGIHDYYKEKYNKESKFLAYGADIHEDYDISLLAEFGFKPRKYYLLVARLEPENNIEMAIQGFLASGETDKKELIIVGKRIPSWQVFGRKVYRPTGYSFFVGDL